MTFKTIFGEEVEEINDCMACTLANRQDIFKQGWIFRDELFFITQDVELAVPGMMVIVPVRHVPNYESLNDDELAELSLLIAYAKRALLDLWECEKVVMIACDKPANHFHQVVVPVWKDLKINNKWGIVAEVQIRKEELIANKDNLERVENYTLKLKEWFAERLGN